MRHILLLLLLTLGRWAVADEWVYNYGVEGGVNLGSLTSPEGELNNQTRIGVVAGVYFDLFPNEVFSLVPGGYIVGKGTKDTSSDLALVLNYFQFRLLGRLSVFRTLSSKLFIDLGPTVDMITQKGTQNSPVYYELNFVRNNDFTLMGGLGFETNIDDYLRLAINAKYHLGLLNIYNTDTATISGVSTSLPITRSSGFFVTLALQFSSEKYRVIPTEDRARTYINGKSKPNY